MFHTLFGLIADLNKFDNKATDKHPLEVSMEISNLGPRFRSEEKRA
jgi:hypothetical protein